MPPPTEMGSPGQLSAEQICLRQERRTEIPTLDLAVQHCRASMDLRLSSLDTHCLCYLKFGCQHGGKAASKAASCVQSSTAVLAGDGAVKRGERWGQACR